MFGAFNTFGKLGAIGKAIAAAWSPLSLWPDGIDSPGMWISPRTLTSEWQDYTGTTPVAVPGTVADSSNPVGLALDIRAGATVLTDPGNHMLQSTSVDRPLLSARVNLLTKTEDFADAAWTAAGLSTKSKNAVGHTGTANSAWTLTDSSAVAVGYILESYTYAAGAHTASAWFAKTSGALSAFPALIVRMSSPPTRGGCFIDTTNVTALAWTSYTVEDLLPVVATITDVTATHFRVEITFTAIASVGFMMISPAWSNTYSGVGNVVESAIGSCVVDSPQLELGPTATTYQRVNTASDYDGDPAKFPYYLSHGLDDFLVTASGGGASTAAMVCIGFTTTLAGSAQTLWTDRTGNTGLSLGISAGNAIVLSGGNGSSIVTVTGDAVSLGTPYVVTALYDGTNLSVQLNNATPVTGACALSAGQAAITVGAATGGASGIFKGSIFEVVYVKDAVTAPADVAEAKDWVAAKTGVTL